jgi:hypothetical protein
MQIIKWVIVLLVIGWWVFWGMKGFSEQFNISLKSAEILGYTFLFCFIAANENYKGLFRRKNRTFVCLLISSLIIIAVSVLFYKTAFIVNIQDKSVYIRAMYFAVFYVPTIIAQKIIFHNIFPSEKL